MFDSLQLQERTITTLVERAARLHGDRVYVELDSGSVRFGDLPGLAASWAGGMRRFGVAHSDRVATLLPNCPALVVSLVGSAWAGTILVALGAELRAALLADRLRHSSSRLVIVHASLLDELRAAVALGVPELHTVVVVGEDGAADASRAGDISGVRVVAWKDAMGAPEAAVSAAFDDVLMINYTSGTTGPSKGVVVTHHHAYCASVPLVDGFGWTGDDVLWTSLPLNHAAGLYHVLLPALAVGAKAVVKERFSVTRFWENVVDAGATYGQIIGTMANLLALQPPHPLERAHRIRSMSCFPAPLDLTAFQERFGVRLSTQAWGMTEVYPNQPVRAQPDRSATCIGRPSVLFELRVVDADGCDVADDGESPGEIVVRPRLPSSMIREYFRNPEGTLLAMRDLWFHTGDRATIDGDGYLYFVGRSKDMIRRRGENISAFEVEREVLTFAGVVQAAAFGVPSELGEEDVRVDVVADDGGTVDLAALAAYLRERLPAFMVPRYLCVRPAFPLTPSGRVEKYKLADELGGPPVFEVPTR